MKKSLVVLPLLALGALSSCLAGPHQLNRSVDDWDQKLYISSPWLDAVLYIVPVIPIAHYIAGIGDFLITDAYAFWFKDAWDGKGTGYTHFTQTPTDGTMSSLLTSGAKWLEIK